MSDAVSGLLAALDLSDTGARTREDIFTGPSEWMPNGRVFGGQVLAQSLMAAIRTTPEDRFVHSMHGYFLRPGDVTQPITFSVDRIHDGRSFSTRRTQAYQSGEPILSMIASFQDVDPGFDHQIEMPADIPDPESLPTVAELLKDVDHPLARAWANRRAFDIRHVEEPIYLAPDGRKSAHQVIWMRAQDPLPDDPNIHRAALAYASDYAILEPVLRKHGVAWSNPGLKVASLDHAMWFHRRVRTDEWLLYHQDSPFSGGARGFSRGTFFDQSGQLIASCAQEGLIRLHS